MAGRTAARNRSAARDDAGWLADGVRLTRADRARAAFPHKTCRPAPNAALTCSGCNGVGVASRQASTSGQANASSGSEYKRAVGYNFAATTRAASLGSAMAITSISSTLESASAWTRPILPRPIRASLTGSLTSSNPRCSAMYTDEPHRLTFRRCGRDEPGLASRDRRRWFRDVAPPDGRRRVQHRMRGRQRHCQAQPVHRHRGGRHGRVRHDSGDRPT